MNARQKAKHYKKLLDKTYELMKKNPVVISRYRPQTICFRKKFPLEFQCRIAEDEIARIIEDGIGLTLAKEIGKYAEMHTEVDHLNETYDVVGMVRVMAREEL